MLHAHVQVLARCGTPELVDNPLVEQQRHSASGTILHFIPVAAGSRDGVDGQAQAGLVIEDLRKSGRAKRRRWAFGTGSGLGFRSPRGKRTSCRPRGTKHRRQAMDVVRSMVPRCKFSSGPNGVVQAHSTVFVCSHCRRAGPCSSTNASAVMSDFISL